MLALPDCLKRFRDRRRVRVAAQVSVDRCYGSGFVARYFRVRDQGVDFLRTEFAVVIEVPLGKMSVDDLDERGLSILGNIILPWRRGRNQNN